MHGCAVRKVRTEDRVHLGWVVAERESVDERDEVVLSQAGRQ